MNKEMKSLIKTLHLLFACLWLGASASIVVLQCLRGWSAKSQELVALNQSFSILDFGLIIPGALGSLCTGFLICRTTRWGFTRYRWIIVKWILTITAIVIGTAFLGPWQLQLVKLSGQLQNTLVPSGLSGSYDSTRFLFTLVGSVQVMMLIFILAVSVRKPRGPGLFRQKEIRTMGHRTENVRSI